MAGYQKSIADTLQDGQICPCCQEMIRSGDALGRCVACGHVQHEHCWDKTGRCFSYECSPASSIPGSPGAPTIVVTSDAVKRVKVPPPRPVVSLTGRPVFEPPVRQRRSILAIVAFGCAVVGAFLFGAPGLLAVLLGAISLGIINSRRDLKGTGFSVAAIVVGMLDITVWAAVGCLFFLKANPSPDESFVPPNITQSEMAFDMDALSDLREPIQRAIRANVLVVSSGSLQTASGSGVVVAQRGEEALILTNRHVTDGGLNIRRKGDARIHVTFADGTRTTGRVEWRASDGIDLALVACRAGDASFDIAQVDADSKLTIGNLVFAVGNPLGLGWTYTTGVISAIRETEILDGGRVRIIQMQVPLNPGNSGGGLYTEAGVLIGVNTFIADRNLSEGINFAISILDLIPLIEKQGGIVLTPSAQSVEDEPAGQP